jgi:hypothetical protein
MADRHYFYQGQAVVESDTQRHYFYRGLAVEETLVAAGPATGDWTFNAELSEDISAASVTKTSVQLSTKIDTPKKAKATTFAKI